MTAMAAKIGSGGKVKERIPNAAELHKERREKERRLNELQHKNEKAKDAVVAKNKVQDVEALAKNREMKGQGFKAKMTVLNPGFVEEYVDDYYKKLDDEEKALEAELRRASGASGAGDGTGGFGVLEGDLNGADASAKLRGRGFTAKAQILNPRAQAPQQSDDRFGAVRARERIAGAPTLN